MRPKPLIPTFTAIVLVPPKRLYVRYAISIRVKLIKVSQKSQKMQEGVTERVISRYHLSKAVSHEASIRTE
jgi:hypothetical protein